MLMQLLRSNWYRLIPILSIVVCIGVLIGSGITLLIQQGWFIWWCLVGLCLSVISILVVNFFREQSQNKQQQTKAQPNTSWTPIENTAWVKVLELASEVEKSPPNNIQEMQDRALELIKTVSRTLHPNSEFASAHFTIHDILVAAERGIKDLRIELVNKLPASNVLKISQLLQGHAFYNENKWLIKSALLIYRLLRFYSSPTQAFLQEAVITP